MILLILSVERIVMKRKILLIITMLPFQSWLKENIRLVSHQMILTAELLVFQRGLIRDSHMMMEIIQLIINLPTGEREHHQLLFKLDN
jgi:hypothetical protein